MIALIANLRRIAIFAGLPAGELDAVARGSRIQNLGKRAVLLRQGAPTEGLYVVLSGQIGLIRTAPDGHRRVVCVFEAPHLIAETALAAPGDYPVEAVALAPARVLIVGRAAFRQLISRRPDLALALLQSVDGQMRHLLHLLDEHGGSQFEGRLAEWIVERANAAVKGAVSIFRLPVAKKVLADELGVRSETLSRGFAHLRAAGLIQVAGSSITVLDAVGLRSYATCGAPGQRRRIVKPGARIAVESAQLTGSPQSATSSQPSGLNR